MSLFGRNDQAVTANSTTTRESTTGAPLGTFALVKGSGNGTSPISMGSNAHFGNTSPGSRASVDVNMFNNTTPGAFITNQTVGIFGVSATEMANNILNNSTEMPQHAGWNLRKAGTGSIISFTTNGGTQTAYNNTDVIKISNSTVNATATFVTNAAGEFGTSDITITAPGVFSLSSNSSTVDAQILAANGATSNGSGATLSVSLSTIAVNAAISAVNNSSYYLTAVGSVVSQTANTIYAKRLSASQDFSTIDNGGNPIITPTITGKTSGVTATLYAINEYANSIPVGENAVITGNVNIANGSVTRLNVRSSGFGYVNNEVVNFVSEANAPNYGLAQIITGTSGKGQGYYLNTKSFLSDDKYIQDGEYYQDYSYEIRSSLNFDKYSDMVKKVVHVAGTKLFGAVYKVSSANVETLSVSLTITTS